MVMQCNFFQNTTRLLPFKLRKSNFHIFYFSLKGLIQRCHKSRWNRKVVFNSTAIRTIRKELRVLLWYYRHHFLSKDAPLFTIGGFIIIIILSIISIFLVPPFALLIFYFIISTAFTDRAYLSLWFQESENIARLASTPQQEIRNLLRMRLLIGVLLCLIVYSAFFLFSYLLSLYTYHRPPLTQRGLLIQSIAVVIATTYDFLELTATMTRHGNFLRLSEPHQHYLRHLKKRLHRYPPAIRQKIRFYNESFLFIEGGPKEAIVITLLGAYMAVIDISSHNIPEAFTDPYAQVILVLTTLLLWPVFIIGTVLMLIRSILLWKTLPSRFQTIPKELYTLPPEIAHLSA